MQNKFVESINWNETPISIDLDKNTAIGHQEVTFDHELSQLKESILANVHLKLNPNNHGGLKGGTAARRMRFETIMPVETFKKLFPNAVRYKSNKKEIPENNDEPRSIYNTKFVKTKRIYDLKIINLRDLDALFGENWDVIYNGMTAGFALPPFDIRYNITTVTSFRRKLSFSADGAEVTFHEKKSSGSVAFSFSRASLSMISFKGGENATWYTAMRNLQQNNIKLEKKLDRYCRKRGLIDIE